MSRCSGYALWRVKLADASGTSLSLPGMGSLSPSLSGRAVSRTSSLSWRASGHLNKRMTATSITVDDNVHVNKRVTVRRNA